MSNRLVGVLTLAGVICVCLGWLLSFTTAGVVSFVIGGALLLAGAVCAGVSRGSARDVGTPVMAGALAFALFPLILGVASALAGAVGGDNSDSTGVQTPSARPR